MSCDNKNPSGGRRFGHVICGTFNTDNELIFISIGLILNSTTCTDISFPFLKFYHVSCIHFSEYFIVQKGEK